MSKTTTTTQKTAKATTETKAETTKKEAVQRDSLNCRLGSQSSLINGTLTSTPKTIAVIAEESGCTSARVSNHLRYLLAKGLVVSGDEGYALPAPAKATKPSKRKTA